MEILLIVVCVVVFLLAIVVFTPVVIAVDSRQRQLRIRWLLALEFRMPLPGTAGQKVFTIFHKPFSVREKHAPAEAGAVHKARRKRRATGRFVVRCLGDSHIRREVARQLSMLLRRIFRSIDLRGSASDVSLPDPALNGMLAGVLAASDFGRLRGMRVNFRGENNLLLEVRFHPHRVLRAFLFFLPRLPYRAVFEQWRAFSAAGSH